MSSPPPTASTTTLTTKLIRVPHLSGTSVAYHLPKPVVGSKPTLVLIPSFLATASTLIKQVSDKTLLEQANLLVLEPLGHGATKVASGEKSWTYWDSAIAFLQAMELLNVKRAFVLGVSQGGWIAVRMGLYAPEKIRGIISIGSNFDAPSPQQIELGCADLSSTLTPIITELTASPSDASFSIPEAVSKGNAGLALGSGAEADVSLWAEQTSKVYVGDLGRQKLRQSVLSLLTRDGLLLRLADLKLPPSAVPAGTGATASSASSAATTTVVAGAASLAAFPILLIRGSEDGVFSQAVAEKDVLALEKAGIKDVTVQEIQGGAHAANWSHAQEVNALIEGYLKKYGGKVDARALREAVGMVDI